MNRLLLLLLGMLAGSPPVLTGAVLPGVPPRPASNKAVAVSDSQIRLSWEAGVTNAGDFRIERLTDAEHLAQIALIPAATNRYTDEGLISSTTHIYRAFSHNAAGELAASRVAHTQTGGPKGHLSLTSWGRPVGDPPAKLDDLVAVAAGLNHQVALQKNGKVTVWGDENSINGQIKFPKGLNHVAAIAAGGFHSLALKSNGEVLAWGANTNQQSAPPAGLKNVVAVAAGLNHSLALKKDGTVIGWGDNSYGQCSPPTNLNHVVAIAAGGDHSLALKSDGTLVAWGQLFFRWARPDWTNIVAIAAGVNHDLLLHRDGTVEVWIPYFGWEWFYNVPPSDLTNVVAIAAGDNHNLALKSDGTVVDWGHDLYGGDPMPEGLARVSFIAAGAHASLALSTLPAPPLQFIARAMTTNQARLSWVDNCTDEDSYLIERAPNESYYAGEWTQIARLRANATQFSDSTVLPGGIYWYRVRAHNRWGNSALTVATTQVLALSSPPTPVNFQASIGSSNSVNLVWNNYNWLSGVPDGYEIQQALDVAGSPGSWSPVGSVRDVLNAATVAFTVTNAAPLQTYWYRVCAYNVFGSSPFSKPVSVRLVPPPAPDWLTVTPFADRMDLNWYVGSADGFGMDGFSLERAPDQAGSPGTWGSLTNLSVREPYSWGYAYSDAGHDLNTTWWYRVRTHNWIGYGPYSTPTNATIILPAAPVQLSGWLGGSHQVNLQWLQYPSDQNGFRIERAADAGGGPGPWSEIGVLQLTNSKEAFFTDKNVTALTTNWYRMRAFNQLGNSDYSGMIAVAAVPPPAPNLSLNTYRSQFTLNYNLSGYHFDVGNFSGYKIERAPDVGGHPGSWTQIAQTFEEAFTDSGYALNSTCWYRVRASNWSGDGAYSPAVSATILPPGTPESLAARVGTANQINVSWSDSHYDQDGFRLERAPDVGGAPGSWLEIAVISATNSYDGNFADTNVVASSTNWYRVRAFNEVGLSAYAGTVSVAVIPPPAPTYGEASVNRDQVIFYWSGDYGAYGELAGFQIERAPDVGGSPGGWEEIGKTPFSENHFTDAALPGNTTWWYRARAYNWIGESEPGPVASATINPPTTPYPVSSRISASNQVDLSWYIPTTDADGFQLERAPDADGLPGPWTEIAVIPATNTWSGNYTDTNLTGRTTNWYRVRAFSVVGSSDYSIPAAIPLFPPQAPYRVWTSPDRDRVVLNWSAYYGDYGYVEGFKIERAPDLDGSPGDWSQIGTLTITNPYAGDFAYADSGRGLNTTWWYRVRAFNWTGDGDYSPPASATIIPPAAPAWLVGRIGSTNEVILSWYQSQTDQDGFRLERAPDDNGVPGVWTGIGIVTATNASYVEFTDTNAIALTTNWYRVQAFNLFGNSDSAEPVQVAVVPPPAPYLGYFQAYRDRIELPWYTDYYGYHGYGAIDGFKVERAPDVGGEPGAWAQVSQVGPASFSYSDSNLVVNATWWYRVRAYNWVGTGDPSQETYTTIFRPGAPDWIVGRIGATNQAKLSWHDSSVDADGFRLERAPDVDGLPGAWNEIAIIAVTNASDIEFADTHVTALATYWYRVQAFNALGESDYTVSAAIRILPPPMPNLSASVYRDQVNLYGYLPYLYDYGQVDGFQLERAPDVAGTPGAWSQIATKAIDRPYDDYFYNDTARPVNATFWYRLRSFNWVGAGDYSPAVSATPMPPTTPNYMTGWLGSTNQIKLTWEDYAQDKDGFQLERAPDTNGIAGAWEEIANIPDPNAYGFTDTNVAAYSTNWYRVRGYNVLGNSGYCAAISVKAMPPAAPGWHNTNYSYSGQVNLSWYASDPATAEGYELERATNTATDPESWTILIHYLGLWSVAGYADTNLVTGGSYAYHVKAFNWVGESPWSPLASITIPPPYMAGVATSASPATPALHITSLILTNQSVVITWASWGGTTNVVQAADLAVGFADISPPLVINGLGIVTTNYLDYGALTNANRRFYRIRGL